MRRWHAVLGLSVGLCLAQTGCKKEDPNSAAHWIDKLNSPLRTSAIQKLGEMKSKEAIEPLKAAYKVGTDRVAIASALAKIDDPSVAPLMIEALSDMDSSLAQVAGEALKKWKIKNTDAYLAVATNVKAPREARYVALELIAADPEPKVADALIPVLEGDPDLAPVAFVGQAAVALGKLQYEKAIPGLVRCLWLDDRAGRNEVPACRLALARIGTKAAPKIIEALERKNRDVEERARKLRFESGGLIEAKCAEVLGDSPDPSAVDPLLVAIKKFDDLPAYIQDPKKAQMFVMAGVQKVISIANALAAIGDERAVKPLLEIANDSELALEHKMAAVQQLAFLGQLSAVPGLQKLLAGKVDAEDPVSNGFRVQIALNLVNLLDGTDTKALDAAEKQVKAIQAEIDKWIADAQKKAAAAQGDEKTILNQNVRGYQEWRKNYDEALGKIAVTRECKADVACWGAKLGDKEEVVYMKAAYALSNMKPAGDKAPLVQALLAHAGSENLVLRNVVLFGLSRHGDKSVVGELQKFREADAERSKRDKRYEGAVYTMDLTIAKLSLK
jgi:HEAT repeat protein